MLATEKGKIEILKTLIEEGADVNAHELDQTTVMKWAVIHENVEAIGLLAEEGVPTLAIL